MVRQSNEKGKSVFVGLSGGVDSAVSAALLKKSGYDVTGVFIKVWQPEWITCNWKEERLEAMRVAAHLDIPFITLDLEKEYKTGVVDYMITEYAAGHTPNPDVMCNREVKFGAFMKWAKERGADYIATGHYARISKIQETKTKQISNSGKDQTGQIQLLTGVDPNKDQSYFLWTLNQEDLAHSLFPVGNLPKPEVRALAKKFKLPNADKKDSQGICFLGKVDIKEFLSHYVKNSPGNVIAQDGAVIGTHPGALFFTIGERHGFHLENKTPHDKPYYVIGKDMAKNTITVSNKSDEDVLPQSRKIVRLIRTNWISGEAPLASSKFNQKAQSRYHQAYSMVRIISANGHEAEIEYEISQDTLTPGQSLVIYDGEICLGGGIIL